MLSRTHNEKTASPVSKDLQIIRSAMIAELDAVSFYEQLAASAADPLVRDVLLDVAKEEKVHVGEFGSLLERKDKEYEKALEEGEEEVGGQD